MANTPLSELDPATMASVLRAIFVSAVDAIGISHDNVIRVVNRSMVRLFGFEREDEMVGRTFLELIAPESRPALLDHIRKRALGEDVPGQYRVTAHRRDGTAFEVDITTTTFLQGGEAFALALLREVRDPHRQASALYDQIFEQNTAVKLLIDPADGRIVDANATAVAFYGWSVEELRTKRITDINTLPPEDVLAELERVHRGQRRYYRFRHRIASGEVRHVDVHTGGVVIDGRNLVLSILQDVTERDAFEEQLRQAQKLEAIGRLAGGVAHDFNNLLTIVMSCADLLRKEVLADGPGPRLLDDLLHASVRASELTAQLLAVGQRQQLRPEPVRLDEVIGRMARVLERVVGGGVALRLVLAPNLTVEVDPGQLEQIVMNLVLNARDATDGRGNIAIEAEAIGHEVALVVRDDGRGMDAATQARVFEPFFTTKARGHGTGLGLASVYGIVMQSGGRVIVESTLGVGTAFTVFLPLRTGVEGSAATRSPLPADHAALRVLIVDDEADVRDVLVESLTQEGLAVRALASGDEAMRLSDEALRQIDVLVTDQVMPGIAGVDLANALTARHPDLRVILMSGHASAVDRARLPPGAAFLPKPFSGSALIAVICRVAGR